MIKTLTSDDGGEFMDCEGIEAMGILYFLCP